MTRMTRLALGATLLVCIWLSQPASAVPRMRDPYKLSTLFQHARLTVALKIKDQYVSTLVADGAFPVPDQLPKGALVLSFVLANNGGEPRPEGETVEFSPDGGLKWKPFSRVDYGWEYALPLDSDHTQSNLWRVRVTDRQGRQNALGVNYLLSLTLVREEGNGHVGNFGTSGPVRFYPYHGPATPKDVHEWQVLQEEIWDVLHEILHPNAGIIPLTVIPFK